MNKKLSNLLKWFTEPIDEEKIARSRNNFNPVIELERELAQQIYTALQGSVVEEVLRKTKITSHDTYWRSIMEGHSLKVEKELLSDLYDLCHEVKEKLKFEEKVDFYITGNSSVNAFSVASSDEGEPHIVNINSALFDLMNREELKFVIGHELGHIINRDTALARLIQFVFPAQTAPPVSLQYKIRLHEQLAELVADRYGYIATENLGVCVTAFFKLASGLDLGKMNVSIDTLIADNNRRLEYFLKDKGISRASHPVNPIRIQALNLFATSESEEELNIGMNELISILLKVGDSKLDEQLALFIASAGLLVAGCDKEINENELDNIIEVLAGLKIFPRKFLEETAQGDVGQIFNDSVGNILKINPGMREPMLSYIINIVLSDKLINKEEVEFIYKFGDSIGFSEIEVANAIAEAIQQNYVPSLESIC